MVIINTMIKNRFSIILGIKRMDRGEVAFIMTSQKALNLKHLTNSVLHWTAPLMTCSGMCLTKINNTLEFYINISYNKNKGGTSSSLPL